MALPGMAALPFTRSASPAGSTGVGIVSKMRVLDIFAGAGGLSIGLEQAGYEIAAGAEWDSDACETFGKAHPSADVIEGDVNAIDFRRWRGDVDVVVGGPPCQPWSTGGKRLGSDDPRDGWPAFLRALKEVRPRTTPTGRILTMRVTEKGQVTIPKEMRDALGIGAGTEVQFEIRRDTLVVRKAKTAAQRGQRVAARLRGRGDVAMTTDEIMALTRAN